MVPPPLVTTTATKSSSNKHTNNGMGMTKSEGRIKSEYNDKLTFVFVLCLFEGNLGIKRSVGGGLFAELLDVG